MNSATFKEEQRYKINRLKEVIDAEQLLRLLGFEITRVTSDEVRAKCKVHGGDNRTSFRMNKHTKNWVCFSHGCHEEIGYDVISLVMHMLNLSFSDAIKYLESITGVNIHDESSYVEYKRHKDRQDAIKQSNVNKIKIPDVLVDEIYLKSFKKFRSDYFEKEENGGFTKEVLDLFEIGGGYVDKFGFQRAVIPIRNKDEKLVAYSCRDVTGKASDDYKYLLTEGFDKDKVLYNLHRAKNFMGKNNTLVIVEGFKSVWKLHMAGYDNVVACMGSIITGGQQKLLYSNAFNIITLFDGDEAGVKGTQRALKDMRTKINIMPLFLPDGIDPADRTIKDLQDIIGIIK